MSRILIFGNVIKDVYLKLGEDQNIEKDEKGVDWINLGFNGEGREFFHRTSMLSGVMVTLEVFQKFGFDAKVAGLNENDLIQAQEYRYILNTDNGTTYFCSAEKPRSFFEEPAKDTKIIIVDKTARISREISKGILDFVENNPKTFLAVFAPRKIDEPAKSLIEKANVIFAEKPLSKGIKNKKVCILAKNFVKYGNYSEKFYVEKADLLTHLTISSIAMASILGAVLRGKPLQEALKFAKENVENSTLNQTLSFEKLEENIEEKKRSSANLKFMAKTLLSYPRGILAADESGGSIHKKFESMDILDDEQHRRDYRNIFFTTRDLEKYVNGVILFEETANQKSDDGRNFVEFLIGKGIIPGIKVDQGLENFTNSEEKFTKGLDGLSDRLQKYYKMGLRFAKWRAAFEIIDGLPSDFAILENCRILAEYAKKCQEERIVPIVEPEVVYDGNYSIGKNAEVTGKILVNLFKALEKEKVELSGAILKVNMVLAGKKFPVQSTPREVGKATANVLRKFVPSELAGVVFLSGGQTVEQATENLQEVTNNGPFPWPVTFSFARALQDPALFAWKGNNENSDKAREGFYQRLVANCDALRRK